jgi:6-phosphogluconolactonase
MAQRHWWVGGYGPELDGTATGIGLARERENGSLEYLGVAAEADSPSFLLDTGDHVYAALEGSGRVDSFARHGLELRHDGSASSGGSLPCQLARVGNGLVVANYDDGVVGVIDLRPDGAMGELAQALRGDGAGPRPTQPGPHAHSAFLVDESTVLTLDLGADRIHVHAVLNDRLERTASIPVPPGTGPRDIARHPSGLVYVLGELSGELFAFEWVAGMLELVASVRLDGAVEGDHGAAIAFGQDGRFVYTGLRGSDRVSIVRASADGRELEPAGWVSCGGKWPRNLVTSGKVLHVANEHSSTIASFRLGDDGEPSLIVEPTRVPSPTFLAPVI